MYNEDYGFTREAFILELAVPVYSSITELNRISPEFRELWPRHDVLNVSEGRKTMQHPLAGELRFDFLWLQTVDSSDLRLLIHTPRSNTGTAEKIERLLAGESEWNAQNTRRDVSS